MALNSIFASRKRNQIDESQGQVAIMLPSNFQVYAKIDEEWRKDNRLAASFLLTLNEVRASVTYEFRGVCNMTGSSADFESIMEANKDSRVPRILDIIYQRLYPVIFMLAGMTMSSYPQTIALLTDMVTNEPIQVHKEAEAIPKVEEKPKIAEKPMVEVKPVAAPAEAPKPTLVKAKRQPPGGDGDKPLPTKA